MIQQCQVCSEQPSKYKCPKYELNYCSVSCFKTHKEVPCEDVKPPEQEADKIEMTRNLFPTSDTVNSSKLEHLRSSDALKDLLRNRHLRNLLIEIDTADNAWKAMEAAMREPLFLEFADEALKVIEPDESIKREID